MTGYLAGWNMMTVLTSFTLVQMSTWDTGATRQAEKTTFTNIVCAPASYTASASALQTRYVVACGINLSVQHEATRKRKCILMRRHDLTASTILDGMRMEKERREEVRR